jgi:hypothetical protein
MELKGIRQVVAKGKDRIVVDNATGEVMELSDVSTHKKLDSLPFIKLYSEGIIALAQLPSSGVVVLCYILGYLKKSKTQFFFHPERCKEFCGYKSKRDVMRGLKSLIEANIIKATDDDNIFEINPNMFYNGKRI